MLINLLANDNNESYNIYVAKRFGLNTSVYLSILMNINQKAILKGKIENDYFKVDRKYIETRSTLSKKDQLDIDKKLSEFKIISKNSEDEIKLDIMLLASLLMDDNEHFINDVRSNFIDSKVKKRVKTEYAIENIKKHIRTTNPELRLAWEEWIAEIYSKKGMNVKTLQEMESKVDNGTLLPNGMHDLNKALDIVNMATSRDWKDVKFAVDYFNSIQNTVHSDINYIIPDNFEQVSDEEF